MAQAGCSAWTSVPAIGRALNLAETNLKRFAASTEINAPVEAVWRVLADLASWSDWEPNTEGAQGIVGKDAVLTFNFRYAAGRPVTVKVTAIDEPFLLEWTGGNEQVTGVRTHRITPTDDGCEVEVSQVFSGPAVAQTPFPDLDKAFGAFVDGLKQRVERDAA